MLGGDANYAKQNTNLQVGRGDATRTQFFTTIN